MPRVQLTRFGRIALSFLQFYIVVLLVLLLVKFLRVIQVIP
ncbi:MAG TPA: hypothetical protein PK545_00435 [Deltaproteobacteria bacterium]|nr:hypothetical protein [Deltaproteobacteria bacterium]